MVQPMNALPCDLTIMADTKILGVRTQQARIPVLVGGRAKSPEALKAAVRKVASAIPTSTSKWLEGQTHNLGVPARGDAEEVLRLVCRISPSPFDG
jgi:hypothetical protein